MGPRGLCRSEMCNLLPSESLTDSLCMMGPALPKVGNAWVPLAGCLLLHGEPLECHQPGVTSTGSSLGFKPYCSPFAKSAIRVMVCEKLPRARPSAARSQRLRGLYPTKRDRQPDLQPSVQPFSADARFALDPEREGRGYTSPLQNIQSPKAPSAVA